VAPIHDQYANDMAALMQMRDSVKVYAEAAVDFMARCLAEYDPESAFAKSGRAPAGTLERAEHRALTLGYQHLFSGLDHLRATADLLRGTTSVILTPPTSVPQFVCFTLLRSCLESSSRAAWLLESQLDGVARASRGMVEQAHSVAEAAKLGAPNFDKSVRLRMLEQEAGPLGITPCEPAAKLPRFGMQRRPDSTSLTGAQLQAVGAQRSDEGFFFRLLSGYAHATSYALVLGVTRAEALGDVMAALVEPQTTWIVVSAIQTAKVHQRALAWLGEAAGLGRAPDAPPLP